ncbi:MAG TPA: hypothetical protein VGS79_22335 [Puia sp.]|nr:hypothetical protein [Puia sp.]
MTYLRHRCTVAFALVLLTMICVQSTGALSAQRPGADPGRNIPTCHCCHGKVFVKLDRRFNLKPVFLLPARVICLADPVVRPIVHFSFLLCVLPARISITARWRGPPDVLPNC